jgi:hypothetical protein
MLPHPAVLVGESLADLFTTQAFLREVDASQDAKEAVRESHGVTSGSG